VYAFGRHGPSFFFAMEFLNGRPLDAILQDYSTRQSLLPQRRAITIIGRIAEGLDAAHAQGLVHRDVKPANIVIEEDTGRPVLIDFGLAVQASEVDLETIEGTPAYMSPEQAGLGVDGSPVGPWSDTYALGCVAFEMITGRAPYIERDVVRLLHAHQLAQVPKASSLRPELEVFDEIFQRVLAKDPNDRYPSCGAFAKDLERIAGARLSSTPPPTSIKRPDIDGEAPAIRVLAVDDDPMFGKFAAKAAALAMRGKRVQIQVAKSGMDALARARLDPPDLVLLDLDMPGLDGIDTLSYLRALPKGDHARVVVLSGRLGPQERWKFAVLGVREFVAKPIDFRRLITTIENIVERAGWLPASVPPVA
jgi:eukaryotic-like serine/threonine-protein kinase